MSETNAKEVLVIDDDQDILDLVSFVLEDEGYVVETAIDGREGLEKVAEKMPDLILLDMKMPIMNGWECARQFHAKYGNGVPIVVLTAAENARQRANEIGAQGWIGKPFDIDALVETVKQNVLR